MLSPPARRSPTCTGRCGDTGALGSIGTSEKCAEVVVYTVEGGPRGHMPAAPQAPGVDEVGEELSRPREDSPGGEEYVILGGEHRHRFSEASKLVLGRHPRQTGVWPDVPVDRPELP